MAPAAIPAASSAATSQSSIAGMLGGQGLGGAGQHQLARPLGLHVRRLGLRDERAQQAREAERVVEVREVARVLEELQPAAGHQLVSAPAVARGDDRVDPAPDQQRGHGFGEVEPVARVDALAAGVDHRTRGVHERAAGAELVQRGDSAGDLREVRAGLQADPAERARDRRAGAEHRARRDQRQHQLRARQRDGPQERADLAPEAAAGDQHQPAHELRELVGDLHRDAAAERVPDDRGALVAQREHQVADEAGVGAERVVAGRLVGLPMAEQVRGQDREVLRQLGQHRLPARRGAGDPVDQDEQRPLAAAAVGDAVAVQRDRAGAHVRHWTKVHRSMSWLPVRRTMQALERALGGGIHGQSEHGVQGLGGERPQALERLRDLRPALLRAPGGLERRPDRLDEQLQVGAGDAVRVLAQAAGHLERLLGRDPDPGHLRAGPRQRRRDLLEAPVAERSHDPQLQRPLQQRGVAGPPALGQLVGGDHLRRLALAERRTQRAREAQRRGARAGALEQPPDQLEAEPVGLHPLDQLQPRDVLRAVVAGAPAHLGRRQQPARLVGAHVAHRHPGALGELVDREVGGRLDGREASHTGWAASRRARGRFKTWKHRPIARASCPAPVSPCSSPASARRQRAFRRRQDGRPPSRPPRPPHRRARRQGRARQAEADRLQEHLARRRRQPQPRRRLGRRPHARPRLGDLGRPGRGAVGSGALLDGNVTTDDLAELAITTAKLADGSVTAGKLADGAVETGKIAEAAVTLAKLRDGAVATGKLADGAATTAKIADGAVKTAKLGDGAATAAKLADGAATTDKVADSAITTAKLADTSVTAAKLAASAVTTLALADGAVPAVQIADTAVTAAKLADTAVTTAKLADGSVTTAKLADNAVATAKVADGAITAAKLAAGAVTLGKIAAGAVNATTIASNAVDTDSIDLAVTTAKLDDNAVTTGKLADGAVTSAD